MNRIPRQFYIAYIRHHTELVDNLVDGTKYGDYNDACARIRIAKRICIDNEWITLTPEQMLNTFWHEYAHALQFYTGKEYTEEDAQVFANFMCEFAKTASY